MTNGSIISEQLTAQLHRTFACYFCQWILCNQHCSWLFTCVSRTLFWFRYFNDSIFITRIMRSTNDCCITTYIKQP